MRGCVKAIRTFKGLVADLRIIKIICAYYITKYFELNATGSGMRYTLSIQTLHDMPILLPSLEEQQYIGNIFSTIDRKIELNRTINHNLPTLDRSSEEAEVRRVA